MGSERRRSPMLAAILNFTGWGLGFLYAGRRRLLGFALTSFILASLWGSVLLVSSPQGWRLALALISGAWILVSCALAREAYIEAVRQNSGEAGKGAG